jgi:hypothetical protein
VTARLAVEVGQRQEEIQGLEVEVARQREEVRKLRVDMDGKTPVFLVALFPRSTVGSLTRLMCDSDRS